ncbi:MAG: helix-turn-helix domain-containing protein [Anaerolineae bacterium]
MSKFPTRPISGGTNDGVRPMRYDYWRTGYGERIPVQLAFWVAQAGEYHCKPGYQTGSFEHSRRTQLFYHLDGEATAVYRGTETPVSRGDLLIFPVNHTFSYDTASGMKHHWLAIEGAWPQAFHEWGGQVLSLGYDSEIEAKFIEIREVLILRKPGFALQAIGAFYELMARVEALSGVTAATESAYPETVRNAIAFLRENYAAPFNAAETAAAVGLSQSHLRALFYKWLGESPRQVHMRFRIDQAKRLLGEQRLTVLEVAFHLGFADARHFSRTFKRITGVVPSQYASLPPGTMED